MTFAPKDVETLKTEALEVLGVDSYEGNEEVVDRFVANKQKDEDVKMSLHNDKMSNREKLKEARKLAGLDPETGEKPQTNVVVTEAPKQSEGLSAKDVIAIRDLHEADVDFIMAEAKLRGLSYAETKALPYIQNTLKVMGEERRTAEAVATKPAKSATKTAETEMVKKANNYMETGGISPGEMKEAAAATILEIFGKK